MDGSGWSADPVLGRPPDTGERRISLRGIDNHLDTAWEGNGEVLEAARRGDRNALEALVTAHYDRVHALCRRMLGNDADALDATQDALLAVIRGLGRFDGRSSFGTWLYRVTTNTCIDELRRRRRRPVTGIAFDVAEVADGLSSEVPGLFAVPTRRGAPGAPLAPGVPGAPGPDGVPDGDEGRHGGPRVAGWSGTGSSGSSGGAGGRDPADIVAARVDVDAALASLPVEFRTAVVLRDVCDLAYDEIAKILDVPIGTVRSRIARARSALAATWKTEAGPSSVRPGHGSDGNRPPSPDVRTGASEDEGEKQGGRARGRGTGKEERTQ